MARCSIDHCTVEFIPKKVDKNGYCGFQISDIFYFRLSTCSLKMHYGWEDNERKIKVELKSSPILSEEFYITAFVFKDECEISYPMTLIRDSKRCVLSLPCAYIEKQLPNAEKWNFGVRFILQKEVDSKIDQKSLVSGTVSNRPRCELVPTSLIPTSQSLKETKILTEDSLEKLSEDFERLLDVGPYHDVQINCGNVILNCHKAVLAARSRWFENKFESAPTDRIIQVNFVDPDILVEIIKYLYKGKSPEMNFAMAGLQKLYEAGDLCDIGCLKQKCIEFLIDNLTISNACECLAIANDDIFKEKVVRYIMDEEIYRMDEYWSPFSEQHPEASNFILNKVVRMRRQML